MGIQILISSGPQIPGYGCLVEFAEYGPHRVGDLPDGRAGFHRCHNRRHEIGALGRRSRDGGERLPPRVRVAARPQGAETGDLSRLDVGIDLEKGYGPFFSIGKGAVPLFREPVDADDDRAACIDRLLRTECGFLNLTLDEPALNRRERAARTLDSRQDVPRSISRVKHAAARA